MTDPTTPDALTMLRVYEAKLAHDERAEIIVDRDDLRAMIALARPSLEPSDAMIDAALQAQCDIPGCHWTDGVTEGVATIMRLKMEKALIAALQQGQG